MKSILLALHGTLSRAASLRINYSRGAEAIQAPFVAFIFYCSVIYPSSPEPGWSVAILGFAAVAMAIRGVSPARVTFTEQVAWILIASLLCGFELYAVSKANADLEKERAGARELEEFTRRMDRRSIQRLFDSGRALLAQETLTSKLAEESLKNITGEGSFPYIAPQTHSLSALVPLFMWNHGTHILSGVSVTIRASRDFSSGDDFAAINKPEILVGVLHPGWGKSLHTNLDPTQELEDGIATYVIDINTQSDLYTEILKFRKGTASEHWAVSYAVTRQSFYNPDKKRITRSGKLMLDRSTWSDEIQTKK